MKTASDAQLETHPSVGLGIDCRLDSKKCTGFALSYEDHVLHLSVFARKAEDKKTEIIFKDAAVLESQKEVASNLNKQINPDTMVAVGGGFF